MEFLNLLSDFWALLSFWNCCVLSFIRMWVLPRSLAPDEALSHSRLSISGGAVDLP